MPFTPWTKQDYTVNQNEFGGDSRTQYVGPNGETSPYAINNVMDQRIFQDLGLTDPRAAAELSKAMSQFDPEGNIFTSDVFKGAGQTMKSQFGAFSGNQNAGDLFERISQATGNPQAQQWAQQYRNSPAGAHETNVSTQLWNQSQIDPNGLMDQVGFLLPFAGMAAAGFMGGGGLGSLFGGSGAGAGAAGATADSLMTSQLLGTGGGIASGGSAAASAGASGGGLFDSLTQFFNPTGAGSATGGIGGASADSLMTSELLGTGGSIASGSSGGGALSGIMGNLNGGLSKINDFLGMQKNPITMGDIFKSGANYLINSNRQDDLMAAANEAANRGDALQQPKRFQYQDMLSNLLSNPSQFYATNPAVQGQLDLAKRQFEANTAKMGTGGTSFMDYLKNVQSIASGTYNDQANLLSGLGGFNQGPGYAAGAYAGLAGQASNAGAEAFRGFGQDIFKSQGFGQGGATSGQASPFGTFKV